MSMLPPERPRDFRSAEGLEPEAGTRMRILLLAIAFSVVGCATRPGVAQAPDGTLTAMRRGAQLGDSTGLLRTQALKDAEDYCAARKQRAIVTRSREIPAIGGWPEAVISFRCE